ncbi:MAG: type VI secretion system contractile sheath large subunit [Isosphaeraceae bacterium]
MAANQPQGAGGAQESLLYQIVKPSPDPAQQATSARSLGTLLKKVAAGEIPASDDLARVLTKRIADIDRRISGQLQKIMHHPEFQRLEAAWRGLHYLVHQTEEAGGDVRIRVLNISKNELAKDLQPGRKFDASALWRKVYEDAYGTYGGKPFGVLIGDYEFSNHPQDVELLKGIAGVAAAAHAPFLAAAGAELFNWSSFTEQGETTSLTKLFDRAEYANWRSFRALDDSRYVGLCLPHFLLRLPYGRDTVRVEGLDFEEDVSGRDHSKYLWGNAAYALAGRIVEAFARYNWCAAIRGPENGGMVRNLPMHTYQTDAGTKAVKCPVEVSLDDRREKEFCDMGFIPLVHHLEENFAVFFGTNSCHRPPNYSTDDANKNARLGTQLQYIMATSRIAHYLKALARDKIGSFTSLDDCHRFLNEWIRRYVTDESASEETKARYPLSDARIDVEEVPGKPGAYKAVAYLRPHFQLDELTMSLRLVARIPDPKGK